MNAQRGSATRRTAETDISIRITLNGRGKADVDTGIGFVDHMLETFAVHGSFNLEVDCDGDLEVDPHHTVEDLGIVLGEAISDALDDTDGIRRVSQQKVPMDEAMAEAVVDVSGRSFYKHTGDGFSQRRVGDVMSVMFSHFFRSLAGNAGLTLHVDVSGENTHHEVEAMFKAVGRAISEAVEISGGRVSAADPSP